MTLDLAMRLTEVLLALAMLQQSAEHLGTAHPLAWVNVPRLALAALLLTGLATPWVLTGLVGLSLVALHRYQGPYNGGSDRMTLLVMLCLWAAHLAPSVELREAALGYLAMQLTLSYVISGWVKVINPEWRRGAALADVFRFSAYPVSEGLRDLADRPRLLWAGSWAVIGLELVFPLALLHPLALGVALSLTAGFHLANAMLFGLNRFFWIWLAAYPALIWFQHRVFGGLSPPWFNPV